jgi:hypothetical protein
MTIQNQEIKEVKSSFGVNAEVADAVSKNAAAPGKVQSNGDESPESIPQGSSGSKTKISMINAVMSKLSKMKKEDVEQQLASMDEAELDEKHDEGHEDEKEDKALIAKMMKKKMKKKKSLEKFLVMISMLVKISPQLFLVQIFQKNSKRKPLKSSKQLLYQQSI